MTLDCQGEIVIFMDRETYNAAIDGDIQHFEDKKSEELLLTPNENTVLHIHFTAEPQTVSAEFTKDILKMWPCLVFLNNCYKETPLHIAARYGHFGVVKILIDHAKDLYADPENGNHGVQNLIRAVNHENNSALHEALRFRHIQIVEILIDEDQYHSYSKNDDGEAPLYMAAARGYQDVVLKMLGAWEVPAYHGPNGRTALHAAVLFGRIEMVKDMLEVECLRASISQKDERGWTPLHYAARRRLDSIAKLLLKTDRKTAYIRDKEGRTALHIAAYIGSKKVMEVILSECPDCSELVDKEGRNALHYAIVGREGATTSVILERPSLSNLFNQKDSKGITALHLVADQSRYDLSDVVKHPRVDKMALDQKKRTPLDIAWRKEGRGASRTYTLLKDNGARRDSSRLSIGTLDEKKENEASRDSSGVSSGTHDEKKGNEPSLGCSRAGRRKRKEEKKVKRREWLQKSRDCTLVVVGLIATVAFTAGFTLPGGLFQDGNNAGSPILQHNWFFHSFIVCDIIAIVLSCSAVFIHLLFLVFLKSTKDVNRALLYFKLFYVLAVCASVAMILAFIGGICAVLGGFRGEVIPSLLLGLLMYLGFLYLLRSLLSSYNSGFPL